MSEATPEKKEAPAPSAPGAVELLELSLTALVNAPGVFARLEARPAPSPATALLAALAWGAGFFALNLVRVALSNPSALQAYAPWMVAAVGAAALVLWAALFLLGAGFVYVLGRGLGSAGDFDRALLVAAVAAATAPAQALCAWFPFAWTLPALVAAWILACGLTALFKAGAWPARAVSAVLAAVILAAQYGANRVVESYAAAARLGAGAAQAAAAGAQLADLQQQLQQIQAVVPDASAPPGPAQGSSLDLLRGPEEAGERAPAEPTKLEQIRSMNAAGDAMNKSMIGMLDSLGPMLNNPMITQNMTLQQKADYAELKRMIETLKTEMIQNKITSPKEQQEKMTRIQALVVRMMGAGLAAPPSAAPPPSGASR